ncbi:MAG: D-alanine--D-alanine ligase [Hydrocarboniphaga sp.]|uniref:D-alanine--D-alanine ligase n=1 Tax=Hydrocarboniphaga sp. TaxID=2033016 RepID=UPI002620A748|nr:D-alanine--D-alanine ligase [Hydrocarboniphaga sp.]MDB5969563.1 D-alanine--D-alanine ligase [Hydrocarboniphaga sp.]
MNRCVSRVTDPRAFGKVAVLLGGWSAERQVSIWSGEAVLAALRARGVDAHGVDLTRERLFQLKAEGFDRAFNLLHGTGGEDGRVQAVLELLDLPVTGSGVLASALAMDKLRSKRIWQTENLPTPAWSLLRSEADSLAAADALGLPLIIKPSEEGSSVGITKVKHADQLVPAYQLARGDTQRVVMAEQFIGGGSLGQEFTCAILDGAALPTIRIVPPGEFYDYDAKYLSNDTRYHCPSGLPLALESEVQALCLRAFEALGAGGWGRVDFLLDGDDRPWLLEANLVPGMTSHSLVPMAAAAIGLSFEDLCWRILETTLKPTLEPTPKPTPKPSTSEADDAGHPI